MECAGRTLLRALPGGLRTAVSTPLVSVCIGTYNREKYMRETLDGVFAQTYPNYEVVVVDDASTDRTVDIIRSYGDRIRLIQRTENSGVCSVTRNQATRAARGEYIAYLDSDDGWYPTKLERQVAFLESHPDIPVCHTYCHVINEQSEVVGVRHEGAIPATGNCFRQLLGHCFISISSVMVRRGIFDQVSGYFMEDRHYGIWGEEHEFLLRVARRFDIGFVPDVLARYRKSSDNISRGNWKETPESVPFHEMILSRKDIWEGVVDYSVPLAVFVGACIENCRFWRAMNHGRRASYFALRALRHAPLNALLWKELARSLGRTVLKRSDRQGAESHPGSHL